MARKVIVVKPLTQEFPQWDYEENVWMFEVADDATDDEVNIRVNQMRNNADWSNIEW